MRLDELVAGASDVLGDVQLDATAARTEVVAVSHDSRAVRPGSIFCCVRGANHDGHLFARAAVDAGAVALVCERPLGSGVPELVVPDTRYAMAHVAATFHGHPSRSMRVVGVTGTNGKTTTVHLLAAALQAAGMRTAVIGTLTGVRTTPESTDLQASLAALRDDGHDAVALEVSSHALVQHRVEATSFAVVAFTNLSRDHLDYHASMEEYFKAKASLFSARYAPIAVIDTDGPYGRLLASTSDVPTIVRTGLSQVEPLEIGAASSRVRWRGHELRVPLGGRFNVANAVLAAEIATALGAPADAIVEGIASAAPVPGRFERVDAGQPFTIVVDYAHTPDGLEQLLEAARELVDGGRVIVVFGCGGERDTSKRPFMARAAEEGADLVVVTSDNPRGEDPQRIIADIVAGFSARPWRVEPDRRAAIAAAIAEARPGDVVVIAGKGPETVQEIAGREEPFDDRAVAAEELARSRGAAGA
ncbi:MAG TPA: UDP-N-acetylmuramoyl-L-alanyl-D-glutamate--2,6-diaminopimelate ligase [Acidimicrobiales bacterium]